MNFWKWLWNKINGNKTMIGAILLMIIALPGVADFLGQSYEIVKYIIILLTGASAVHHIAKGSFKEDYK